MKYDKMVECSLERSKQKVETARNVGIKRKNNGCCIDSKNRLF